MNRPDYVCLLDLKPGRSWTPMEVLRVTHWWLERDQERLVWFAAYRYLGSGVSHEDIEEAWSVFYTDMLEKSRLSYQPGGPDFATYALHVCFKRECVRRGEEIRKRSKVCISLTDAASASGTYDEEIASQSSDPSVIAEHRSLIRDVLCFLEESTMPLQQKNAFTLKHFDEKTNQEIALELHAEVGTVKVWAHRAAVRVQEHLRTKGWVI